MFCHEVIFLFNIFNSYFIRCITYYSDFCDYSWVDVDHIVCDSSVLETAAVLSILDILLDLLYQWLNFFILGYIHLYIIDLITITIWKSNNYYLPVHIIFSHSVFILCHVQEYNSWPLVFFDNLNINKCDVGEMILI